MHGERNDRRRARIRWGIWLAAAAVAALLVVRAVPGDDAVDALGAAITALRAAERALDDAAVDIGAAGEATPGQDAGPDRPHAASDAAQRAESAARAAGRASSEARAAVTRVRHMRLQQPGTFTETVAAVRGLRDAARALTATAGALRDAAQSLRDAGAPRAAHRALLAADDTLDAAEAVLRATTALLDGDERFDAPPPAGRSTAARRRPPPPPDPRRERR